jgi:hypothetical protein
MFSLLLQTANQNLLLGFVPESIGLLIFGFGLIALTVGLRWALKKGDADRDAEPEDVSKPANG